MGRFLQLLRKDGMKLEKRKNDIVVKDAPDVTKRVIQLAAEADVQLRYLNSQKRSLEELFVNIIEENEGATCWELKINGNVPAQETHIERVLTY